MIGGFERGHYPSFIQVSVCMAVLTSLSLSLFSFFHSEADFFFETTASGVTCSTSTSDLPVSSLHAGSSCVTISCPSFFITLVGGKLTSGSVIETSNCRSLSARFLQGKARAQAGKATGHALHSCREW